MRKKQFKFEYEVYESINDLEEQDAKLLAKARKTAESAYAPYSHFFVGAAALLQNNKVITGTNQENASYPVTICAERTLLSSATTLYPNVPVETMAITYHNHNKNSNSNKPISPCGMCRQSLLEYELRWNNNIRLLLSGIDGEVIIVKSVAQLLPLCFTKDSLI